MMIRQDFEVLPPKSFLLQILDPTAKIYIVLWERKNDLNRIKMKWKEITKQYNRNTFRTSLRRLNGIGLIDYEEDDEGVSIEVVGWSDIEESAQ